MTRLKEHFIKSFVSELENINGTDFEYLCVPVFSLIINEEILHKGHNLYAKPVAYTADFIKDDVSSFGQCGTDPDYFSNLNKPIHDIQGSLNNHKKCEVIYLFANRRASGGQLTQLKIEINAKWQNLDVNIYDAEKIANIVFGNIHNTSKIEEVLSYLPKTFEYYRILPQTNKLPAFKTKYYKRQEEESILDLLKNQDYIQIYGISGIGKTELSINIGNSLQDKFDSVIWLNGDSFGEEINDLSSVHISKFKDTLNLDYFLQEFKVLIIIDNLNKNVPELIELFNKSNKHNSKCIISSLQRNVPQSNAFELSFLERDIAEKILLNTKIKAEPNHIESILNEISGYPLVLNLIISAIEVDDFTWDEIINEIQNLKDFPDSKNQKLSQRIVGKFVNLLEVELLWLKTLNNRKISRHFLNQTLGKRSISELEKRSLIRVQDVFFFDTHQLILDSIVSEVKNDNVGLIQQGIEKYLAENNEIKSVDYYRFLLNHMSLINSEYEKLKFPNNLKKVILYALIQTLDSFNSPEWFLQQLNLIDFNIKDDYYDLLLFIEKSEIELFQIDKKSDAYKEKTTEVIKELNNVLEKTTDTSFKIVLYHHIGKLYLKGKDDEKAEQYFQKVLELDSEADYCRLQLARLYVNSGKSDKAEIEIDTIFSNELDFKSQSLSILLSFYELLARNDFQKLRQKHIDSKVDLFIKSILYSLDSNFEQPYKVIEKLSGHLSYMLKDIYNEICETLPFPSNIGNNRSLRFAFAKIKLSQYKMLKYSDGDVENEKQIILQTSEKYFKTIDFHSDYERKQLLDLYIASEQFDKAIDLSNEFDDKENSFFLQNKCKILRGKEDYDGAIKAINEAINNGTHLKTFFIAAFLNDKAEILNLKKDKQCLEILQEAIDKQNNHKTKTDWTNKKENWIEEYE